MHKIIRTTMVGAASIAVIYALVNVFGNFWPHGVIGIVVAIVLFYTSQFVQPPETIEAPPPELDMTRDFGREMAETRRLRREAQQSEASKSAAEPPAGAGEAETPAAESENKNTPS